MRDDFHPPFFAEVPGIRLRDPLAGFLGAARDGIVEYRYADAVRLAGHSCPTVASAYLMAHRALARLYPDSLPERGGLRVEFGERRDAGVTGVVAAVVGLVTGAADDGGFRGIAGRFGRRDLLRFGQPVDGEVRFTRLDTGAAVDASAGIDRVAADPRLRDLMARCVGGQATADECALFRDLWQDRVRRLLLEHADDPEVILLRPVPNGRDDASG